MSRWPCSGSAHSSCFFPHQSQQRDDVTTLRVCCSACFCCATVQDAVGAAAQDRFSARWLWIGCVIVLRAPRAHSRAAGVLLPSPQVRPRVARLPRVRQRPRHCAQVRPEHLPPMLPRGRQRHWCARLLRDTLGSRVLTCVGGFLQASRSTVSSTPPERDWRRDWLNEELMNSQKELSMLCCMRRAHQNSRLAATPCGRARGADAHPPCHLRSAAMRIEKIVLEGFKTYSKRTGWLCVCAWLQSVRLRVVAVRATACPCWRPQRRGCFAWCAVVSAASASAESASEFAPTARLRGAPARPQRAPQRQRQAARAGAFQIVSAPANAVTCLQATLQHARCAARRVQWSGASFAACRRRVFRSF